MNERTLHLEIPASDVLHMHVIKSQAAKDVLAERKRQDEKWGGPGHDDHHSVAEWAQLIEDYAGWARVMAGMNSFDKARRRLIQVAALALAAAESMDRTHGVLVQDEALALARRFHDAYERLAPMFGYETREETREFDPGSPNGRLMVAVCRELFPAGIAGVPPNIEGGQQ